MNFVSHCYLHYINAENMKYSVFVFIDGWSSFRPDANASLRRMTGYIYLAYASI